METLWQDLRYGVRMLARSPGFTSVAVLSLALGIGANTTIFTLINAVFLNPLPVAEPSRLVRVFTTDSTQNITNFSFLPMSRLNYEDFRDQSDAFSGLAAFSFVGLSLTGEGDPQQIAGQIVTGNYFDVLGVKAALGRTFLPEEDQTPGAHPVVILSHGLWERQFGSDPGIIGKVLTLNGSSFTVIGVAPRGFKGIFGLANPDLMWVPMMMYDQVLAGTMREFFDSRRALGFFVVGRLKESVSLEQAQAGMSTIAKRLEQEYPNDNSKRGVVLQPLASLNPNQQIQFQLAGGLLMTVVGLVLLIACANVANLLLARAATREKEMSIRAALGAGRTRLIRQLLTESIVLSLAGGGAGLLVALWGRRLLWAFRPPFLNQNAVELALDARVLGFTLGVSLLTGLLFGVVPAVRASDPDLNENLKVGGRRGSSMWGRSRLRGLLVVAEVALALVALIGAGLFVRSLQNAQRIDPGFESEKLIVLFFNTGSQGYTPDRAQLFYQDVVERVEAVSGVEAATLATLPPLSGGGFMRSVTAEGMELPPGSRGILTLVNTVTPGFFKTLGIPLLRGRAFSDFDRQETLRVAVINQATVKRFWPDQDPIGKRFTFFSQEDRPLQVVGVVKDTLTALGQPPQPIAFMAVRQNFVPAMSLQVRTSGDPEAMQGTVRSQVQALDRNMPLTGLTTISQILDQNLWAPRMGASLLSIFALLALVLASVGIYGVISYSANQRTHEIGIRMALGAQPGDIFKLVVGQGLVLALVGVGIGLAAAFALTRFVSSLLFGVSATDLVTFTGVSLLLVAVALLACYLPARRATKVDPLVALRYE